MSEEPAGLAESTFNKWRCLIALAYVDNKLDPAEKTFLRDHIESLRDFDLTDAQFEILIEDLEGRKLPAMFIKNITDPVDRIDLVRLAYDLFLSDGDYDAHEEKAFEFLNTEIASTLGIDKDTLAEIATMDGKHESIKSLLIKQMEKDVGKS